MKNLKNKWYYKVKSYILKYLAIFLIIYGGYISISSGIKFAKSYFAFTENKTEQTQSIDKKSSMKSRTTNISSKDEQKNNFKVLYENRPKPGDEIGKLYIPKLKATFSIYEGTDEQELSKGAGHYEKSVLPGEKDNSVLSGHRDTVFRNLGKIGKGDLLIVETSAGKFKYKVNKVRIVDKDDRTVIVPKPSATLTLSTCYPFRYIGSAPKRYIVSAYLSSEECDERR